MPKPFKPKKEKFPENFKNERRKIIYNKKFVFLRQY